MIWSWKIPFIALAFFLTLVETVAAGTRTAMPAPPVARVTQPSMASSTRVAQSSAGVAQTSGGVVTQRVVIVRPAPFWWYDPFWGPAYYAPYPSDYTGNVKIVTKRKGDAIYVDDGFAGVTGKLKKFALKPGNHTIALRDSDDRTYYHRRIHVIAGKTVEIHVG